MPAPPQIVFGGASLGHEFLTEESVQEVLTLLQKLGITQIDTAARYPPINHGMSEKLLGITHAASQGFAIDTKIFTTGGDGELDRASIQKSVSASLERLGVNQVIDIERSSRASSVNLSRWISYTFISQIL
jgi:aflatoxin B1 aldehyde reductase